MTMLILLSLLASTAGATHYTPDWHSLDQRPLPQWYDEAKVGIFFHWGVYSVPACRGEWFWSRWMGGEKYLVDFMKKNYPPDFTYQDFASQFRAELFRAGEFLDAVFESGARYFILTTKHHEGYTLFPSRYSPNWNSVDVGPKMDIVAMLNYTTRNVIPYTDIKFGLYYSLYEWYHPLYIRDKQNKFQTQEFVDNKMMPEMKQLINDYKPEILWVDGDWEAADTYFRSRDFLAWLYNDSPVRDTVVVNDRWGKGIPCHHGDFYSCKDNYNPGKLVRHKWESATTIDRYSWGYRRELNLYDLRSVQEIIGLLVETVSCGGNFALNIGPDQHGNIPLIFRSMLKEMGRWLEINGEAIYATKPWNVARNDSVTGDLWYTTKGDHLYAIALTWPEDSRVHLGCVRHSEVHNVSVVGSPLPPGIFPGSQGEVIIELPPRHRVSSDHAWTIKMDMPPSQTCTSTKHHLEDSAL